MGMVSTPPPQSHVDLLLVTQTHTQPTRSDYFILATKLAAGNDARAG